MERATPQSKRDKRIVSYRFAKFLRELAMVMPPNESDPILEKIMKDSLQEAGGAGYDRANPAEQINATSNVPANLAVATNPDKPASPKPEPLPEHVKAAQRRKIAKVTAEQARAETEPDRSVTRSTTVKESTPMDKSQLTFSGEVHPVAALSQ